MVSGYGCGMMSHVHAVLCTDCRELRICQLPGHPADLPWDETERTVASAGFALTCPVSSTHNVRQWADPGPCPRCGEPLARGEEMILWD
jgi:hypothetical protein